MYIFHLFTMLYMMIWNIQDLNKYDEHKYDEIVEHMKICFT